MFAVEQTALTQGVRVASRLSVHGKRRRPQHHFDLFCPIFRRFQSRPHPVAHVIGNASDIYVKPFFELLQPCTRFQQI
ncbi:hypothetical protein BRUM_1397 [Bifidobacterium ruminantium]|uniref:Uncharacterized protein n=1 Tax=Bifidobacterium ruminantium TaxID=78346 RepID=A0A087CRR0_BIFRU|nr:hypothetical protein BRUM_1397 [Bifidobacterium ruminantium]